LKKIILVKTFYISQFPKRVKRFPKYWSFNFIFNGKK